ncbi:MAG: hypothetical protein HOP28_05255 [Gemmatimonadales bacterium]|nr:hypothetical protein [Gemmatimonadales bacterium]
MSRLALVTALAFCAACGGGEKPAEAPAPAPPAPAPINLADVSGEWTVRAMAEGTDSTLVTYTLTATADTTGWTITLPNRPPMPMQIAASGDSVVGTVAPYESVLRKGVTVSTHSVLRLLDGKLVGTTVARYSTTGADSVANLRTEGVRKQ